MNQPEYMVMECHPGYAVLMDRAGRFYKAANFSYQVGQRVDSAVIMTALPPDVEDNIRRKRALRRMRLLAAAACLVLVLFGSWALLLSPVGYVQITINPSVQLTVNRMHCVTEVQALNTDGTVLLTDYRCFGKSLPRVSGELVSRAASMGYLAEGDTVYFAVEGKSENWAFDARHQLAAAIPAAVSFPVQVTEGVKKPSDSSESEEDSSGGIPDTYETPSGGDRHEQHDRHEEE